jgi:hypothetical protein
VGQLGPLKSKFDFLFYRPSLATGKILKLTMDINANCSSDNLNYSTTNLNNSQGGGFLNNRQQKGCVGHWIELLEVFK